MTDQERAVIDAAKNVVAARQARYAMDLTFRPNGVCLDQQRKREWEIAMVEHTMVIIKLDEALREAVEAL
jgi:hypothetical protein